MCIPPGGVFTVTRELITTLAARRPDWHFTLALSEGRPVHQEFKKIPLPANASLFWTPAGTANRAYRLLYENTVLPRWAKRNGITAALQVNGMMIPALGVPTFSHAGDPWPYRHDLWSSTASDRFVAFLKRHEHERALRNADFIGWTSAYLRDLVCDYLGFEPKASEVLHNGLCEASRARARAPLPAWDTRPMEVLTVSNVVPYKRQSLVIEAIAVLARRPGYESLRYRIVGHCEPAYAAELMALARSLGVADRVIIEGRVSQQRIDECYAQARAFAFMSVCECFGIPPIEAMTFGTPAVVAECCSAREIYGGAAEFCPPDDVEALASALHRVLNDADHAEELRRLGAARTQMFSWENTAERMGRRLGEIMGLAHEEAPVFAPRDLAVEPLQP